MVREVYYRCAWGSSRFFHRTIPPYMRSAPIYLFNFKSSWLAGGYHIVSEQERAKKHRNSAYKRVRSIEGRYQVYLQGGSSEWSGYNTGGFNGDYIPTSLYESARSWMS